MVYTDTDIWGFDLEEALLSLPPWRRERVRAIKAEQGKRLSVMAYRLLCRALREAYGIREQPTFGYEEGDKPFLVDHPHICFNLSHCRAGAACAVASHPVGIDAETVRPFKDTLARHTLNEAEYQEVTASADPAAAFIRLWTMKEAYAKLTGRGLRDDLKTLLPQTGYRFTTQEMPSADGLQRMIVTLCEKTENETKL